MAIDLRGILEPDQKESWSHRIKKDSDHNGSRRILISPGQEGSWTHRIKKDPEPSEPIRILIPTDQEGFWIHRIMKDPEPTRPRRILIPHRVKKDPWSHHIKEGPVPKLYINNSYVFVEELFGSTFSLERKWELFMHSPLIKENRLKSIEGGSVPLG